ncbi:MAG: hypothetical protein ACRC35_11390 [Angustibacter sp.]
MWAHALQIFDAVDGVVLADQPPLREISVGIKYRLRVKKHDAEGRVSTFLTQGALDFLEQEPQTLKGMEEVRLIAGYRWLVDETSLGSAVISLRDGRDKPLWMHDLAEPEADLIVTATPLLASTSPRRPDIRLPGDEQSGEGLREGG